MTERRAAVTHLHGPLGGPPLQTELRHRGAVAGRRLRDGQERRKTKGRERNSAWKLKIQLDVDAAVGKFIRGGGGEGEEVEMSVPPSSRPRSWGTCTWWWGPGTVRGPRGRW